MNSSNNKVILITGAASGIGKATAELFAQKGAKVMLSDVQNEVGKKLVQDLKKKDYQAEYLSCDVSQADQVKNLVQQTVKTFGKLDYAFNNAGIEGEAAPTADCTIENWQRVMDVNLKSVFLCMKYQIPELLKNGGGSIVNNSSIAGVVGFPGIPAYVASKHAIIGLTKTAALEYATKNIRINAVCPGVIQTAMIDRFTHGEAQATRALTDGEPMGRMGKSEEIAEAVWWLCSSASFVTGHPLVVDGGWVAR